MRFTIYAMVDPRDGRPRYVGCSVNVKDRVSSHMSVARTNTPNGAGAGPWTIAWLRELLADGLRPGVSILQRVDTEDAAAQAEQAWMARFRRRGEDLMNVGGVREYRGYAQGHITRRASAEAWRQRVAAQRALAAPPAVTSAEQAPAAPETPAKTGTAA